MTTYVSSDNVSTRLGTVHRDIALSKDTPFKIRPFSYIRSTVSSNSKLHKIASNTILSYSKIGHPANHNFAKYCVKCVTAQK